MEERIYGATRIASCAGVSERTVFRWCTWPEGQFFEVASMSNHGGSLGRAVSTFPSSLCNFLNVIWPARVSHNRAAAAQARWQAPTAVNSCQAVKSELTTAIVLESTEPVADPGS